MKRDDDAREARETKLWLLGLLIAAVVAAMGMAGMRLYHEWGPWLSRATIEGIIKDAEQLGQQADDTGVNDWKNDQIPPHIRALEPQFVSLLKDSYAGAATIRIQTSGGFYHAGYIVLLRSDKPDYVPSVSHFRTKHVYKNLFYFEE